MARPRAGGLATQMETTNTSERGGWDNRANLNTDNSPTATSLQESPTHFNGQAFGQCLTVVTAGSPRREGPTRAFAKADAGSTTRSLRVW